MKIQSTNRSSVGTSRRKGCWAKALAAAAVLAMPASSQAILTPFVDTFTATTLDARWTLDDLPGNYSGGSATLDGALLRFNSVFDNGYAHIETPLDTTSDLRADAIMRQDHFPVSTWGMSLAIYYDTNNWVAIRQGAAGGQLGWLRDVMDGGSFSEVVGNTSVTLRTYFLISGIEMTSSQILFYGSQISPLADHYGQTNIEANTSLIPEFTMARPAGFTGNALLIVGKGTTQSGFPNPDFDNNATLGGVAFAGIDYVRVIPEPTSVALMAAAGLILMRKRGKVQQG